jgi:late competence protein required for DNA uptake (superfamily II DNA/RNA helicase)
MRRYLEQVQHLLVYGTATTQQFPKSIDKNRTLILKLPKRKNRTNLPEIPYFDKTGSPVAQPVISDSNSYSHILISS